MTNELTDLRGRLDQILIPNDFDSCQELRYQLKELLAVIEAEILEFNRQNSPGIRCPSSKRYAPLHKSTELGSVKHDLTMQKMKVQHCLGQLKLRLAQLHQLQDAEPVVVSDVVFNWQLVNLPIPGNQTDCRKLMDQLRNECRRVQALMITIEEEIRETEAKQILPELKEYSDKLRTRLGEVIKAQRAITLGVVLRAASDSKGDIVTRSMNFLRLSHEMLKRRLNSGMEFDERERQIIDKLGVFLSEMHQRQRIAKGK